MKRGVLLASLFYCFDDYEKNRGHKKCRSYGNPVIRVQIM